MDDIFASFRAAQSAGAPGATRRPHAVLRKHRGASMPAEFNGATATNTQCAQLAAALEAVQVPKQWVTLCGPTGVGKSRVAAVYMLRAVARNVSARWVSHRDFIDEVRATYSRESKDSRASVLTKYASCRVLIIDDVVEQSSAEAVAILEQLVEMRHGRGKFTVMTTNLTATQFEGALGARAFDRVASGAMVTITGESYRRRSEK